MIFISAPRRCASRANSSHSHCTTRKEHQLTTVTAGPTGLTREATYAKDTKGEGWILFAGIMPAVASFLNVIYGIAAIADSRFFVHNAHYIISSLNAWAGLH